MMILPPLEMHILTQYGFWFLVCFGLFSLLAELFPNIRGQRLLRSGFITDLAYWFLAPLLYIHLFEGMLQAMSLLLFDDNAFMELPKNGLGMFTNLPTLAQLGIALLLTDIIQYWSHRLFHGKTLWKFHVIHHATEELDWLSGVRFHPVNMVVHSVLVGALIFALGFSPLVYLILFPVSILYSALVHANLNWTFGPMRFVFASPVFHRFHHTGPEEGGERNFAPTFSFLDLLFGTFYLPKDALPQTFGVHEAVPKTLAGQLTYPFGRDR